jgi:peptide/nickel transport system substrate-binding protein
MLWTGADPGRGPVGTGPFVFGEYQNDRMLRVRRNPDYWGQIPPNQELVLRFMRDPQARVMAVASGQADIAFPLNPSLLASLGESPAYRLVASPMSRYIGLSLNHHGASPFDILRDVRVRRALGYAIDRQALVDHIFKGQGRPAKTILLPRFWGQGDDFLEGYSHDPARAAALLDQAGWLRDGSGLRRKQGRELKLRLVAGWPAGSELRPIPEVLHQMLAQVGVGLEIVETDDHGVYYDGYMKPGKADMFLSMGFNSTADPTFLLFLLFHSQTPWTTYGQNWFFPGPEFDAAVDRARQGRKREDVVAGIQEAQRILIDERAAMIPIAFVPDFYLVRPGVSFQPAAMEFLSAYGYAIHCREGTPR